MPKISVIISAYNTEQYLRECLDSVINQTLKDIEIIIVDDGSTDNSPAICDEYAAKDNRIKVIHKENSGLGQSNNIGMVYATAQYIGFVESDDWAEPDMFENLYNIAAEHDADVVKSKWYNYYTTPEIKNIPDDRFKELPINQVINAKSHPEIVLIKSTIWSAIYKKDFLNEYKIKFTETPGASYQDTSFAFMTAAAAKRFVLTDKAYIHYRQNNMNSSVKAKDKVYAICGEYERIDKFLDDNPDIKNFIEPYKWQMQFNGYQWNIKRIADEYKEEFAIEMRNTFLKLQNSKSISDQVLSNLTLDKRESFNALLDSANYFLALIRLEKKNSELNNKNQVLKQENKDYKKLISKLNQDNTNYKAKIAELKQKNKTYKQKLNQLKTDNKSLKLKVEELSVIKINLLGIKISHRRNIR